MEPAAFRFKGLRCILAGDPAAAERAGADGVLVSGDPDALSRAADALPRFLRLPATVSETALLAALAWRPAAVVLGDCEGATAIQQLGARLAVGEALLGLSDGAVGIVAELAPGGLTGGSLRLPTSPRLVAVTWDVSALAAACGGGLAAYTGDAPAAATIRTLVVLAAAAAGVPAWDTADEGTGATLARRCRAARRLGFTARFARNPHQVGPIRAAFGREDPAGPDLV